VKFNEWLLLPAVAVRVGFDTPVGVPAFPPPPPPPPPPLQAVIVIIVASATKAIAALSLRFFELDPTRKRSIAALKRNAKVAKLR
jgi:hypothetical protein